MMDYMFQVRLHIKYHETNRKICTAQYITMNYVFQVFENSDAKKYVSGIAVHWYQDKVHPC